MSLCTGKRPRQLRENIPHITPMRIGGYVCQGNGCGGIGPTMRIAYERWLGEIMLTYRSQGGWRGLRILGRRA